MNKKIFYILTLVGIIIFFLSVLLPREQVDSNDAEQIQRSLVNHPAPNPSEHDSKKLPKKIQTYDQRKNLPPRPTPALRNKPSNNKHSQDLWSRFSEKYGTALKPQFVENGLLIGIKGGLDTGTPSEEAFHPDHPEVVKRRSDEILAEAQELLGLQTDSPVQSSGVKSGPLTAQVYYEEFYHGKLVLPASGIRIDLGPKGQLISLSSDYAPNLKVVNQEKINLTQAQEKAIETIHKQSPGLGSISPDASQAVIWIHSPQEAYAAYRILIDGREVVINAENGSILINRDRRQY